MIYDGAQRTPEWDALRLGRITASRISDLMAKPKSGSGVSKSRERLEAEKVSEILTGEKSESTRISGDMQWGIDTEAAAIDAYEVHTGSLVHKVCFATHPVFGAVTGASPDGLLDHGGMVEIKCPATHTHIATLEEGAALGATAPREYVPQMQWGMDCAEREWCDFVSFDPRLPENCRLFIVRVRLDRDYINRVTIELGNAQESIAKKVAFLKGYGL